MADHEEPGLDPEFGIRALGYSRRQVDEFVAEVRRELRGRHPVPGESSGPQGTSAPWETSGGLSGYSGSSGSAERAFGDPVRTFPPAAGGQVSRMLRLAQEEVDNRIAEARRQAEKTLMSAREVADRLMADARRRSVELEERVSAALDREVTIRVEELVSTHDRLLAGLVRMRDSLGEALDHDAMLGPVRPLSMAELAEDGVGDRVRVYVPRPGGHPAEQVDWRDG